MNRVCISCGRDLPLTSYTSNQWSKGPSGSKCAGCVHGHHSDAPSAQQSDGGRYNEADRGSISHSELDNPFASGAFRWVGKGVYTTGARSGQACVFKWFKTGAVFEDEYFTLDIKEVDRALELVNRFNELNIANKAIKINVPSVWTYTEGSSRAGQKVLVEPFIENYQKFNSNTGWNDDSGPWPQVMQALSRKCNPQHSPSKLGERRGRTDRH